MCGSLDFFFAARLESGIGLSADCTRRDLDAETIAEIGKKARRVGRGPVLAPSLPNTGRKSRRPRRSTAGGEGRHPEAASAGEGADLEALSLAQEMVESLAALLRGHDGRQFVFADIKLT